MKAVARLIAESVRESDFVARYRDDAFAVVLTETRLEQAGEFCRRLRDAARQHSQLDVELRISTGAVEPSPDEDVATLLGRAEAAVQSRPLGGEPWHHVSQLSPHCRMKAHGLHYVRDGQVSGGKSCSTSVATCFGSIVLPPLAKVLRNLPSAS